MVNNNVYPIEKSTLRVLDIQIDYLRTIINYNWKKDEFSVYNYQLNKKLEKKRVSAYNLTLDGRTMQYRRNTKKARRKLELTNSEMKQLFQQACYYCGRKPYKNSWNGIDRVDNLKGYEMDNCVPCCSMCNSMKETYTVNEFLNHVQKIHNYSLP